MRQRRPTGYSPSGLDWPTGYSHPVEDERTRSMRVMSRGGCWCGDVNNHDWPGKEDGAPHPRGMRDPFHDPEPE